MKKLFLFFILYFLFLIKVFAQVPYYYYPVLSGTTNNLYDIRYKYYTGGNANYICGANGTLLMQRYEDSAWLPAISNTSTDLNGILSVNTGNSPYPYYYIFGNNGILLRSTNNGMNWSPQYSGYPNNLKAGVFLGTDIYNRRFIAIGSNGLILKKMFYLLQDSTWTIVQSGTTYDLRSICYKNRFSWISGIYGTILKSIDTGNTWNQQFSYVTNNLNSISFSDSLAGFVVGDGGMILKTSNRGLNWIQKSSGTNQNLNCINSTTAPKLWIAGDKTILYSTDNGETWFLDSGVPQYNFYSLSFFYSSYYGTGIPYFVGENGKIYRRTLDTIYHPNIYAVLKPNNISAYFSNRGIFDKNVTLTNVAGFEWPKGTGKTAIFTAGLNIGAFVNGQLREVMASYSGEYSAGYCVNGNYYTNEYFKYYKVSKNENAQSNWDWAHWGDMVPYGAPFIDVNNNGIYEPAIDTPGVANAKETIFYCMTDANLSSHSPGEGFGGGTLPLGAEVHMTAWAYDTPSLQDVQFISYDIINKSTNTWNAVKTGIVCDPDLGDANDDYIGCDTALKLAFCYNGNNDDAMYGLNPPAVGFLLLTSPLNRCVTPNVRLGFTSFNNFKGTSTGAPFCETDPNGEPYPAYLMLSGFKKDSTCYLDPTQVPPKKTKFEYTGDPETNIGWTEVKGSIYNCGHDSTGSVHVPNSKGDRRLILGSGANNFNIIPGESQKFVIAQLIARDSGNLKSVTKLKQLCAYVRSFYDSNFIINVNQISTNIPQGFELKQNYPNPFNPVTTIRYSIPILSFPHALSRNPHVLLKVYDILGREIETLVNEFQKAGTYEVTFDGTRFASSVYFYKLYVGNFTAVKKMILMK